jgi:hypothetical protein
MRFKKNLGLAAERSAITLLNAASISRAKYEPIELPEYQRPVASGESDVRLLGKLLVASGAVVTATGLALELLPEPADNFAGLTITSGLGAAAIGGIITAYEKLN